MLHFELPHVNVLSKIDLLRPHAEDLDFALDFYTEVQDLGYLVTRLNERSGNRHQKLNEAIAEVVEDFGLVSFHALDVQDQQALDTILKSIDRANGFSLQGLDDGPGIWGLTAKVIADQYPDDL
eukprot:NODE_3264_length_795_cov_20.333780_g2725_i0.p2 GENE.NODE_3264_length_795_cov_20.333780_g2725_i0~~NODE_3264_length_795_cov_20.333780_g2725_i0.p2  ORF type:complete len:124 (-),score=38.39 NODE_3264_length_795_cov_20.333780_g2725_i0:12-383(-)